MPVTQKIVVMPMFNEILMGDSNFGSNDHKIAPTHTEKAYKIARYTSRHRHIYAFFIAILDSISYQ